MDRLDLEEQIQSCWNTKDDIDLLVDTIDSKGLTTDQVRDALIGIAQLHEMRCQRAFDTFSSLVHSNVILAPYYADLE